MERMYRSPNLLQLEGLSARNSLLAVTGSVLGGNEWHGELRVFRSNERPTEFAIGALGAARLQYGASCCEVFYHASLVACGQDDGSVCVYHVNENDGVVPNAKAKLAEHDDVVSCIALHSSDNNIVSGSWDRTVKIWDVVTSKVKQTIELVDHIVGVSYLDENVIVCAERDGSVGMWDVRDHAKLVARTVLNGSITSLITSDSFVIIGGADGQVVEWTPQSNMTQALRKHNAAVHALAVCPDTKILLSGSDDGCVFNVGKVHDDFIRGAAWWNGRPVTSSWDGTLRIIEL